MPILELRKNYRNITGIRPTDKAVGQAQFESSLERDFLRLLEFAPEVVQFESHPFTLHWLDASGKTRKYTPDVLVKFDEATGQSPWLCEIKYRADLKKDWAELKPRFKQGIKYAKQQGWRFRVISELEVRTPYLEAAKFLLRFRRYEIPVTQLDQLAESLASSQKSTVETLLQTISPDPYVQAEWLPAIWHQIAHFKIGADLKSPSPLKPESGDCHERIDSPPRSELWDVCILSGSASHDLSRNI